MFRVKQGPHWRESLTKGLAEGSPVPGWRLSDLAELFVFFFWNHLKTNKNALLFHGQVREFVVAGGDGLFAILVNTLDEDVCLREEGLAEV